MRYSISSLAILPTAASLGQLHARHRADQFGDGVDNPLPQNQPLALQMPPCRHGIAADEPPGDDRSAGGDGLGNDLSPGIRSIENNLVARVHVGALRGHNHRVEARQPAGAVEIDRRIGLHGPHRFQKNVVC